MKSLVFWGVAPAVLAAVCGSAASAHADQYQIVARVGMPASGTSLTASNFYRLCNFSGAEPPVISGTGRIVFKCEMNGGGLNATNNTAVFCADPRSSGGETLRVLGQSGSPFGSTTSGVRLSSFSGLQASNNGRIGYHALLSGTGVSSSNIRTYWCFDGQQTNLVARDGSNNSGTMIGTLSEVLVEGAAASEDVASFKASVPGQSGVYSFYNFGPDGIESVATVNAPAPGITGASFSTNLRRLSGGAGDSLVYSTIIGSTVSSANNSVIYLDAGAGPVLAVRSGQTGQTGIAGTSFSSLFGSSSAPAVNARGRGAFTGTFAGTSSGSGVWRTWLENNAVSRQLMVKVGDPASGGDLSSGSMFATFTPSGVSQNLTIGNDSADSVALIAGLAGPGVGSSNDRSLWRLQSPTSRELVMRGGQSVGAGMTIVNSSVGTTVRMNRQGQMALRAMVTAEGATAPANAIFRYSDGQLSMVAREGQEIASVPGAYLRNVRWLPGLQFNDLGQIVFIGTVGYSELDITGQPSLMRIDQAGNLGIVASTGMAFTTSDGQSGRLGSSAFSDSASLSNNGEITFVTMLLNSVANDHVLFRATIEATTPPPPPPPRDPADINNSGTVSEQDLFDFLSGYFAGDLAVDMDDSGGLSVQDLFVFLQHYFNR